jgi:hypothetical protein
MIEIEKYKCNDKNESTARERYYVEKLNANLNQQVPGRTEKEYKKQYCADNNETIKQCNKQYRDSNKEQLKLKASTKYNCQCGGTYIHANQARHNKTKKHTTFINNT